MTVNAKTKFEKLEVVTDLLKEGKFKDIEQFDLLVEKNGYKLSIYERIFVLKAIIGYLKVQRNNIQEKLKNSYLTEEKENKKKRKLDDLNDQIKAAMDQYDFLTSFYDELFKKSVGYYH